MKMEMGRKRDVNGVKGPKISGRERRAEWSRRSGREAAYKPEKPKGKRWHVTPNGRKREWRAGAGR